MRTTLIVLSLIFAGTAGAAEPGWPFEPVGTGTLGDIVNVLYQDRAGLLWIGTQEGLFCYDGYTFTPYRRDPEDARTLSHNSVLALLETRDGTLWIGTDGGGLNRFDRDTGIFSHYTPDATSVALSHANVLALLEARDGTLWIGTRDGLDRFDPRTGTFTPRAVPTLPSNFVQTLWEDPSGTLWIGTQSPVLTAYNPATGEVSRYTVGASGTGIRALHGDGHTLWVGVHGTDGAGGLYRFDIHTRLYHPVATVEENALSTIVALAQDAGGGLWIGTTEKGLYRLDLATQALSPQSLDAPNVRALWVGEAGHLWVGTFLNGLYQLDAPTRAFEVVPVRARSQEGGVLPVMAVQEAGGRLWLGTLGGGLIPYAGDAQPLGRPASAGSWPLSPNTLSLAADGADGLWVGTYGEGLLRFRPGTGGAEAYVRPADAAGHQEYNTIMAIHEDPAGQVWLATNGGGLARFDPAQETFTTYRYEGEGEQARNYLTAIVPAADGGFWVSGLGGLNRFDPRTERLTPYDTAFTEHVLTMRRGPSGALWLGTNGGGLYRLAPETGTWTHYTEADGLPGHTVGALLFDDAHNLWVDGLAVLPPGATRFTRYTAHTAAFGEVNPNAAYVDAQGHLIFGSTDAFLRIDPTALPRLAPPALVLRDRGGRTFREGQTVPAADANALFPLDVLVLDYAAPSENRCTFRVKAVHTDWLDCEAGRGLLRTVGGRTGDLGVEVRGESSYGIQQAATFTLSIPLHWWQRWPTRTAGVVLLFGSLWGLGYGVDRRRLRKERRELALLEEAGQKERDQLAAWLHDEPINDLVSTRFELEALRDRLGTSEDQEIVQGVLKTLADVRQQLRNTCGDLLLPSFDRGLSDAIRAHAEVFQQRHPQLEIELQLAPDGQALPPHVRHYLFLIYRTALHNVVKHAGATTATVRLDLTPEGLSLVVADDGRGFEPPKSLLDLGRRKHYGLVLAEAQARTIGGRLIVDAAPGRGTRLRVERKHSISKTLT